MASHSHGIYYDLLKWPVNRGFWRTPCAISVSSLKIVASLFGSKAPTSRPTGRIPEGRLVVAVGDLHGRLDLLERLWRRIEDAARQSSARERIVVFLGDYIDRGPQSRQLIDRLLAGFAGFQAIFLKGNHDDTLLQFLDDPKLGEVWRNFGGIETLRSYGVEQKSGADWAQTRAELLQRLPPEHLKFLQALRLHYACGDYLFVHAGVRPGLLLEHQSEQDLLWIRDEFLDSTMSFGRIVVHGHTPERQPVVRANRIGIDTGAYMTGVLTALVLEGRTQKFLSTN
ncbi:MAG: serine/threonine protein phosphatase [Alphaproteobacteria bacterium]|nr:serine/threonine protein phosphatase [Alphaproteobacteria bacterium]